MNQRLRRVRVESGARIHFGLLNLKPPFGGIGVMVDQPTTVIQLDHAARFEVHRSIEQAGFAQRVESIARRVREHYGRVPFPPVRVSLPSRSPSHCGFGSGTQFSIAVAEGLCRFWARDSPAKETLAVDLAGRARRSAVGAHGYFAGGLIFEANECVDQPLNPIQSRVELPDDWCVLLVRCSKAGKVVSGPDEQQRFDRLPENLSLTRELRQIAYGEVMPAAEAGDFEDFSKAIEKYNHQSGMLFRADPGRRLQRGPCDIVDRSTQTSRCLRRGANQLGPRGFCMVPINARRRSIGGVFRRRRRHHARRQG